MSIIYDQNQDRYIDTDYEDFEDYKEESKCLFCGRKLYKPFNVCKKCCVGMANDDHIVYDS